MDFVGEVEVERWDSYWRWLNSVKKKGHEASGNMVRTITKKV